MTIRAYGESYLDDAMSNLGDMMDYAVCDCHYDINDFFTYFITSGIAEKFGTGNPKYVVGMSGVELAREVIRVVKGENLQVRPSQPPHESEAYWVGWVMAYYQWYSGMRFQDMADYGLGAKQVLSMYVLHEADLSKFVETADQIIASHRAQTRSRLERIRKERNLTQQEMSDASGVSLRMIRLYEKRQSDINAAQAGTVMKLAQVLGCKPADLLG